MASKRKFPKFLMWFFGIIVFLLLLVLFGASFFADKIGSAVIKELNKSLVSEIKVENYDLTLTRYFPNAAVSLKKVQVPDDKGDAILLEADELAFRFGLFSLFGSNMKISSMVIRDGALFVSVDKNGEGNYDIFKTSEEQNDPEDDSELAIRLEEARMANMELIYINEQSKHDARVIIDEVNMAGEFSGSRFALNSDAEFKTVFFETPEGRFIQGKQFSYDADVDVDLGKESYDLKNVLLQIEENKFAVDGTVKRDGEDFNYDLTFDGKDCSLQSLIGLLPEGYIEDLTGLKSKGDFTFNGSVKGKSGEGRMPGVNVRLGLKDGSISGPQLDAPFRDLTFTANFTNGKKKTLESSVLEIPDFKGYLRRERIELKLRVNDLEDPKVDIFMDGAIPLDAVYTAFGTDMITGGGGDLEIKEFKLNGKVEEMINPSLIYKVKTEGSIEFDDAMLKVNGEKITFDKGTVYFDDNELSVSELTMEGLGSKMTFNGSSRNLLPVLLADSINSKDAKLIFDGSLTADMIDVEKWMKLSAVPEEGTVEEEVFDSLKVEQGENREHLYNFLDGNFRADVEAFRYGKIEGENFKGNLTMRNNRLLLQGDVNAMDGAFDLDATIDAEAAPKLKAKLRCKDIDGEEFFRQTDNFGQEYITDKNIRGRLDAIIGIKAFWDEKGNFLMDDLHVISDLTIRDGELVKFGMLEEFSKFVKLDDLRHVRFTKTRNWLEVKNSTLNIPVMLIQNNAINLTLSGEHTYENEINYNVKVNAGQVVMKKLFKRPGAKPIKAKNGLFNLYYRIYGNIEDYKMESAKREVKEEFEKSERKKRELQMELEREFGTVDTITEIDNLGDDE